MTGILIKELYKNKDKYLNKDIRVSAWVKTVRASKNFGFIELNDGTYFNNLQVVFEEKNIDNYNEISKLNVGSAITAEGKLVEAPNAKQPFELKSEKIIIEGNSDSDYPLQKKRHSFEYLRSIAHLRPRTNTYSAVFRVRSLLAYAIHKFFQEREFVYVNTPIITGSDCEGAGEMFKVSTLDFNNIPFTKAGEIDYSKDFFNKQTNLTVSGQLEGEAFCMAFNKIYTFGPTFRAENSNTARHASEFWMIEPEIAFSDLNDDMDLAEEMIKYVFDYVMNNLDKEMEFFNKFIDKELIKRLENVINSSFDCITYTEAIEYLQKSDDKFEYEPVWGNDLQTEHERYLTEKVFKKPIFVVDYPKEIKAFYMRLNDDNKTVSAMDLLVPGVGEIIGGSQREERINILRDRIAGTGLCEDDYWWYLDLRKYGGTKHSGFGLGFERAIMYLTGMKNIRDVIPFPRTPNYAEF